MNIHADFTGGNIRVLKTEGADIYVQNEIRDTTENWFYWAFCVEGAQGQTLHFHFDQKWVGYYGPAVSHDFVNWSWLGSGDESRISDHFSYTFAETESCVWFAHNLLYHPAHWEAFCQKHNLKTQELCRSEKARSVPCLRFGEGKETLLLTCRHHACEATGSHVLEGVIEELLREPIPGLEVVAVPFVDYDGVVDGDQGKRRAPHDHYVDYPASGQSLYASVRRIREIASEKPLRYAFDFHAPYHAGKQNDWVFFPQEHWDIVKNMTRLQNMFEKRISPDSLPYSPDGTYMPGRDWNILGTPSINTYMHETAGAELSMVLETPYFKCLGVPFTQPAAREMGRCFVRALRDYHNRPAKISFTGTILVNNAIHDRCRKADGFDYLPLFTQMWGRLPDADYLTCTLAGEENNGQPHSCCFMMPDAALDALKKTGFDLLSMSSIASAVCSENRIPAMLDACDRAGLDHIGLRRIKEEALFIREIRGFKVGFVSANGSASILEEADERNFNCSPQMEQLKDDLQRARTQCDFVIVLLHSDGQSSSTPDVDAKTLEQKCREYGADLIICQHTPVILPSELKDDCFIAGSLGSLIGSVSGSAQPFCPVHPDFSVVLNLTLQKKADGSMEKHLSFRLCQQIHDPDCQCAPYVVDTYDQWCKFPDDAYKDTILFYANRFMPGMKYTEPMDEYPIC